MTRRSTCEDESDATNGAESGFTLLEAIIALAILALSLSGIFQMMSISIGRTAQSEAVTQARVLAQSLLARVGHEIPAKAGEQTGDDGHGMRWRLLQKPYGELDERARGQMSLMETTAEVIWGQGGSAQSVSITTLRLASQ
jgi:general secretion pathway protein I